MGDVATLRSAGAIGLIAHAGSPEAAAMRYCYDAVYEAFGHNARQSFAAGRYKAVPAMHFSYHDLAMSPTSPGRAGGCFTATTPTIRRPREPG